MLGLLSMMCCTAKYPVGGTGFLLLAADALFADDVSSVPLSGLPASLQGRLKPFLERRKQLCSLSDDGRQHVNLTPAGAMLGGGSISSGVGGVVGGGSASAPSAPLLGLAAGGLPGGNGGGADSTDQVAAALMPGVAAAQSAAKDYKKWVLCSCDARGMCRKRPRPHFDAATTVLYCMPTYCHHCTAWSLYRLQVGCPHQGDIPLCALPGGGHLQPDRCSHQGTLCQAGGRWAGAWVGGQAGGWVGGWVAGWLGGWVHE